MTKDELKKLIPHGKRTVIAERAGVTLSAVTNFFNGKTKSSFEIEKAALEVAAECKAEIKTREKQLSKLI